MAGVCGYEEEEQSRDCQCQTQWAPEEVKDLGF